MARTSGSSGPVTFEAIRRAGLRLIYKCGYEAMSLRQLAAEINLTQSSLYNHIATKQELLFILIDEHMRDLLQHADLALEGLSEPSERLAAFVEFHVSYHVNRKQEVFISYSELRSLEPGNFEVIVGLRKQYEQKLIDILQDGAEAGVFTLADAQVVAYGILSMLAGICTWYDPKGRLSRKQLTTIFLQMVQGAVRDHGSEGLRAKVPELAAKGRTKTLS